MKNVKTITIIIETEKHLDKINKTASIKRLFRENLIVGDNVINVNHFNYSEIQRMNGCLYTIKN